MTKNYTLHYFVLFILSNDFVNFILLYSLRFNCFRLDRDFSSEIN
jgi:hypothetical protein